MHKQGRLLNVPLMAIASTETIKTARPRAAAKPKARAARLQAVTDTVTDTDAPQKPARRRKRQTAPAD